MTAEAEACEGSKDRGLRCKLETNEMDQADASCFVPCPAGLPRGTRGGGARRICGMSHVGAQIGDLLLGSR
eukprot:5042816-Prymnesium_polylepis.2